MFAFFKRKAGSDQNSSSERTPLLASSPARPAPAEQTDVNIRGDVHSPLENAGQQPASDEPKPDYRWKWLIYLLLLLLCMVFILILLLGVFAETYAREAAQLNLSRVTVEELTAEGVSLGVKGDIRLDARRVHNGFLRLMGRMGTSIAKKVSAEDGTLYVHLPNYDNALLGTATIPPMVINIQNGQRTSFDIATDAKPGSLEGAGRLAEDYLNGRLDSITLEGRTRLRLKSGIFPLGRRLLAETVTIKNPPSLPKYDIRNLEFGEVKLPSGEKIAQAVLSATIQNSYEVKLDLPPLGFSIIIPGCRENLIHVATAITSKVSIEPLKDVEVQISGLIPKLPKEATAVCSGTARSPLDHFLDLYFHGNSSKVFIRGLDAASGPEAPQWLVGFLEKVKIPISVPGHPVDNLIKSFKLDHVKIKLPSPDAKPGTPEAAPKLSATVQANIKLPKEIKFSVDVNRTKAEGDLSYLGDKLGEIHMGDWVPATSRRKNDGTLDVQAELTEVPLKVTNRQVFQKVFQRLLLPGSHLTLGVDGTTDVEMRSPLGTFAVRGIPAHGNVTVKGLPNLTTFQPQAKDIIVTDTTKSSISLTVNLMIDNPTSYEAIIPYANIFIVSQGHILGNASIENAVITSGSNTIEVRAIYDPLNHGGEKSIAAGERLLSEYVSGYNTTITLQIHKNSLPPLPDLSEALSGIAITVPAPKIYIPPKAPQHPSNPNEPSGSNFRIVESAIMHIVSSRAEFVLANPLRKPIFINSFSGEALYNNCHLGSIDYNLPFAVKPREEGKTITPRIPVDWSFGSAAYRAMLDALDGQLKIQAMAKCRVAIGKMEMWLKYNSTGVPAHIRWF